MATDLSAALGIGETGRAGGGPDQEIGTQEARAEEERGA
jgi:hypothetical protein